jgi:acyl-CoA synthetase (NDP forming)
MSGGFGEGSTDASREDELLAAAERGGTRVLGPNCMGTHSPAGRITYMSGVDPHPGHVAIVAQSGGLSSDLLRRGARRGLRFRGLVTVGNCADVGPAELAGAFLDDTHTRVLGMYIEDPRRGRRLFEALRTHAGRKPVVLLVGGTSEQGRRAALSHTGALTGDARAWDALAMQTGAVLTETLDEFLDVLLALQQLAPSRHRATREVVLFGNGGGTGVLAADAFARAGLRVSALPRPAQDALETLQLPVGTSVANPIDAPANVLAREEGRIVRRIIDGIFDNARPEAFVIHVNVPVVLGYSHVDILGNLMAATLARCQTGDADAHVVLVLRSDGEPEIEALKADMRERALDAGIPVYNELTEAARALRGVAAFESAACRLHATTA